MYHHLELLIPLGETQALEFVQNALNTLGYNTQYQNFKAYFTTIGTGFDPTNEDHITGIKGTGKNLIATKSATVETDKTFVITAHHNSNTSFDFRNLFRRNQNNNKKHLGKVLSALVLFQTMSNVNIFFILIINYNLLLSITSNE